MALWRMVAVGSVLVASLMVLPLLLFHPAPQEPSALPVIPVTVEKPPVTAEKSPARKRAQRSA